MEDVASELRLFLQGICCDYLLFRHLDEGVPPEAIRIRQEVALGAGAFADIEVRAGQAPPYFVEIDTGYSRDRLLAERPAKVRQARPRHRRRCAGRGGRRRERPRRPDDRRAFAARGAAARAWPSRSGTSSICVRLLGERFGVSLGALGEDDLLALRNAVDHAKGVHAFGDGFQNDPLQATLLWHLAFWRVRRLREARSESVPFDPAARPVPGCRGR